MRKAILFSLVVLGACRGGQVTKEDDPVTIKKVPPRPMSERKMLAVVDFEDKSGYGQGRLGRSAADVLITLLFEAEQFRMIERTKIDKVLEEQKIQHSGVTDDATAVRLGRILNVDFVAYGAVTNFGMREEATDVVLYQQKEQIAESSVSVRLIHVETGEIVYAAMGDGKATRTVSGSLGMGGRMSYDETLAGNSLRAAIAKFVDKLVDSAYRK
jgi:curli biogenesis system outer membrane secretion channel CsgG